MYIHSNIRALRRKHKMTQKQLAEKLDKAYITIGDYERGRSYPPLNVIDEICRIFKVDIGTLVYHDIERQGFPSASSSAGENEQLREKLRAQKRLTQLQEQRLAELEREIRERAPELAKRLGL